MQTTLCSVLLAVASAASHAQSTASSTKPTTPPATMQHTASGAFTVTLRPLAFEGQPEGTSLGRMSIDKTITGDLTATTQGQMLSAMGTVKGSAGYVAWDESVSGDLSNSGTSPTALSFGVGSNIVRGFTGRAGGIVDRDYFSVTVPAGWQIDTLNVLLGTTFVSPSDVGFIAVQAGPQVTVNPTGGSASGLLGWVHYSVNDVGTDILGLLGIGPGASGFATPLPSGTYSFWMQDTAAGVAAYNFDFRVSAVPEVPSVVLLLAGGAALAGRRAISRHADRTACGR